jgi:hypothetical protein
MANKIKALKTYTKLTKHPMSVGDIYRHNLSSDSEIEVVLKISYSLFNQTVDDYSYYYLDTTSYGVDTTEYLKECVLVK